MQSEGCGRVDYRGTASLSLQAGVGARGGWGLPASLQSSITQADAG